MNLSTLKNWKVYLYSGFLVLGFLYVSAFIAMLLVSEAGWLGALVITCIVVWLVYLMCRPDHE